MPVQKLKQFLDEHQIRYVTITHSPAFTAQEIAASAHIPGKEIAKTVMVKVDGALAMAVLPAPYRVDLEHLREATEADTVELATEDEFKEHFPQCDLGAMPPFGNLYGMKTYMAASLEADEEIAFSAGSHTELIRMSLDDYVRLVQPIRLAFSLEPA